MGGACLSGRRVMVARPWFRLEFGWYGLASARSCGARCLDRDRAGMEREASGKRPAGWFEVSSTVGSRTEEGALMSTEVIPQPLTSHRGRRRLVPALLATVVAVGVAGAVVVALSSGATSGGHSITEPSAIVSGRISPECGVDLEYLAAEVGTMPETVRSGVIAGLSPQLRQLVDRAIANQSAGGAAALLSGASFSPPVPDGQRLTRVLAAIPAADARVVMSGLSPEQRAEVGASSLAASPAGSACR